MNNQILINELDEVLNRQVPYGQWDAGEPMWTAFGPQTRDNGLMSTLRGHVSPAEAYRRHTEDHGLRSRGTWGIRVGDAVDVGLACIDDGGAMENPEDHASVDFQPLTKAERKIAGRKLHEFACKKGPLYTPAGEPISEA